VLLFTVHSGQTGVSVENTSNNQESAHMYGTPTRSAAAAGGLAVTGVAYQSWIIAGVGLIVLGTVALIMVVARRQRS
jgi:hypothetical protein